MKNLLQNFLNDGKEMESMDWLVVGVCGLAFGYLLVLIITKL